MTWNVENEQCILSYRKADPIAVFREIEKMSLSTICRVCLAVGMRSFRIEGSLQLVYERLMSNTLHTAEEKPVVACYICYAQLNKCLKLMMTCTRAENILNHILHKHSKITSQSLYQFDRVTHGLSSPLTIANTEYYDSTSLPSVLDVKLESASSEPDYDCIKMEKEQSDDIISINIHDMKFEIEEEDIMTQVTKIEGDKNKEHAVRKGQDLTTVQTSNTVQTSKADNHGKSKFSKSKRKKPFRGPFQCYYCHQKFKRLIDMNKHSRIHNHEKIYECDICQYRAKEKNALIQHFRIHSDEKPFKCDSCQRRFRQSAHLVKHLRTHSGKKPYECDICQRQFGRREKLVTHLCTHTGEKRYKCDLCRLRFCNTSDLSRHSRTHTGEKPYVCDVCQQQFAQAGSLKRHLRTHTGEKPYQCDVCSLPFNRKSSLLRHHERKHTGKKRRRRRTKMEKISEELKSLQNNQ